VELVMTVAVNFGCFNAGNNMYSKVSCAQRCPIGVDDGSASCLGANENYDGIEWSMYTAPSDSSQEPCQLVDLVKNQNGIFRSGLLEDKNEPGQWNKISHLCKNGVVEAGASAQAPAPAPGDSKNQATAPSSLDNEGEEFVFDGLNAGTRGGGNVMMVVVQMLVMVLLYDSYM